MAENHKVVPLDEALKAVDSPEAVADRRKRAQKWAEELEGDARGHMFALAGWEELNRIKEPFRYGGSPQVPTARERAAAEREAGRIADEVVLQQCMISLRARDVAAVYNDPARMAHEKVWNDYAKGVAAIAWSQGNKEADFVRRWRELIAARRDAEEYDDCGALRSIDARLQRLTGLEYPVFPSADTVPEADRTPSTDGTATKPKGRRTQALSTAALP